jgi:hypothetical protein
MTRLPPLKQERQATRSMKGNHMQIVQKPTVRTVPNRRTFLKGLGLAGTASVLSGPSVMAGPNWHAQGLELSAKGTVTDFSLIWPAPPLPPLGPGVIVRVHVDFPGRRRKILEFHSFVALETVPDDPLMTVTLFHMRVDDVALSSTPVPNFGLFGQVIYNPVVNGNNHSPWGDLTGRISITCGKFDAPGDHTNFTLLGGATAGSHASALWSATGSLHLGCSRQ